MDFVPQCLRN
uniref:Uncharacterized protein n=1 Tax=Anguilla anguilla TaxID=7936 RepID=A0A0E9V140_ANGAN